MLERWLALLRTAPRRYSHSGRQLSFKQAPRSVRNQPRGPDFGPEAASKAGVCGEKPWKSQRKPAKTIENPLKSIAKPLKSIWVTCRGLSTVPRPWALLRCLGPQPGATTSSADLCFGGTREVGISTNSFSWCSLLHVFSLFILFYVSLSVIYLHIFQPNTPYIII